MLGKDTIKFPSISARALVHDTKPPSAYDDGQVADQSIGLHTIGDLVDVLSSVSQMNYNSGGMMEKDSAVLEHE
jgi:hypothetical protein